MADSFLKPIKATDWEGKSAAPGTSTLREKLLKRFSATDWVRVINVDEEPFSWQYLPAQNEQIAFDNTTSTVPMKIVHRDPPEVYVLQPAQSAIIIGASAVLMIEGLIKKLIANEVIARQPNMPAGQARQFGFTDDVKQEQLINQIYLGKYYPGSEDAESTKEEPSESDIEADLGIEDEAVRPEPDERPRVGRPRIHPA